MKRGVGTETIPFLFNKKKYHFVVSVFLSLVVLYTTSERKHLLNS